jgi:hypothetical protein
MSTCKIAPIVGISLASVAFGAVSISTPATVPQAADGTWTLDVMISITGNEQIAGFGLLAIPALPGGQDITGRVTVMRTHVHPLFPVFETAEVKSPKALTLTGPDLGGVVADVLVGPFLTAENAGPRLMTLQFTTPPMTPPTNLPVTLHFQGTWVDATTIDTGGTLDSVTVLTPEPVSALLVAAGAAGAFGRRNRRRE